MNVRKARQKTLLTPREASERLSVPVATVYWWYAMGKIDGINISGGTLRLFAASLQEFSNTRESILKSSVKEALAEKLQSDRSRLR